MYVRRVVLKDVRAFEKADLDLAPTEVYPGWAVVTGDNGSGKTALLRAISLGLLGPDQTRDLVPDLRGWTRAGGESAEISVEVLPNHEYDRTSAGGYPAKSTFWAEVGVEQQHGRWALSSIDIFRKKRKGAANGPWNSTPGWLAVAYGPFRRLYGSSPDAQRLMVLPGRTPNFGTLFREDATLSEAEEWIKNLHYRRLEGKNEEKRTLESALRLLNNDFLKYGVTVEDVTSEGVWLKDAAGQKIRLSDMSEGFRSALAMLIDIFRHMVIAYGPDIVRSDDEEQHCYVDRPGFVMIDEIDAHLHPDWQREIGFWLKSHFPKVQFLVTTHSPLVCQAADEGRIYHLPAPGTDQPFRLSDPDFDAVVAGRADEILLTPAFGLRNTRSPRAVRALKRHADLKAKQRSSTLSASEQEEIGQLSMFAELAAESVE